jgi:hypothetical protein
MPYPVVNLIEGRSEPISVRPADSAQRALSLMIEYDFSQLPVIDEAKKPLGMITYDSILRALSNFGVRLEQLRVSNAVVRAQTYRPEDDLFDLLDRLKETNAVLIVDGEEKLIGIVTSYDSTEYFRRRAEDMMLVEDVESMVKDLVLAAFTDETGEVNQAKLKPVIKAVTSSTAALMGRYRNALRRYLELQGQEQPQLDKKGLEDSFYHLAPKEEPKEFDDLTLYEYTELLLHKNHWERFGPFFDLEPSALRNLLSAIRETRNDLAHFRGEISATQRDQLRFCADWLAQHPVEKLVEHLVGIPVSWPTPLEIKEEEKVTAGEAEDACVTPGAARDEVVPTEESLGPGDSRYAPLAIWLQSRPSKEDRIQLTFEQVEEAIEGDLPPSARTHRSWWANDSVGHVQSQQWLDVGWRVAQINMTEEKVTFARIREREAAYIAFFSALLTKVREKTGFPLRDLWPDGSSWHTATSLPEHGPKCLHFVFAFSRGHRFRVELYIDTGDQEKSKFIFDRLRANRDEIHKTIGDPLSWERLSEKRASRIAWYRSGAITDDEETLEQVRAWAVDAMVRLYGALAEPAVQALDAADKSES